MILIKLRNQRKYGETRGIPSAQTRMVRKEIAWEIKMVTEVSESMDDGRTWLWVQKGGLKKRD